MMATDLPLYSCEFDTRVKQSGRAADRHKIRRCAHLLVSINNLPEVLKYATCLPQRLILHIKTIRWREILRSAVQMKDDICDRES
jgi:hypothetical protein